MNWSNIGQKLENTAQVKKETLTASQISTNEATSTSRAVIRAEQERGEAIVPDYIPRAAKYKATAQAPCQNIDQCPSKAYLEATHDHGQNPSHIKSPESA